MPMVAGSVIHSFTCLQCLSRGHHPVGAGNHTQTLSYTYSDPAYRVVSKTGPPVYKVLY